MPLQPELFCETLIFIRYIDIFSQRQSLLFFLQLFSRYSQSSLILVTIFPLLLSLNLLSKISLKFKGLKSSMSNACNSCCANISSSSDILPPRRYSLLLMNFSITLCLSEFSASFSIFPWCLTENSGSFPLCLPSQERNRLALPL